MPPVKESKKARHSFKVEAAYEYTDDGKPTAWSEVLNAKVSEHPTPGQADKAGQAECDRLTNGHPDRRKFFRHEVTPVDRT